MGERSSAVLRRLIAYTEKIFELSARVMAGVSDRRREPRIPTAVVVKSALALFWTRMGSLHALEMTRRSNLWPSWLGRPLCSADSLGRIPAAMQASTLRQGLHHVYVRLKRNKALPDLGGLAVAVLDGHETHASYQRRCPGCLQRTIHTASGDRLQYYHRNVTLMLLCGSPSGRPPLRLLLDQEPQRPGEDEVTAGLRLLERVLQTYPRAFDLILADALYGSAGFLNWVLSRRKHALVVLKDERRHLYQDAARLFEHVPARPGQYRSRHCLWWDFADLVSWPEVPAPLRVVRSQESWTRKPQLTRQPTPQTSDWIWMTTLSPMQASTARIVEWGHRRWDIENYGFNALVNDWHTDHVYKHDPNAIECFLLLAFLAYNLFHAFWVLNLKPQMRRDKTETFWARLLAAEICLDGRLFPFSLPP